MTAKRFTWLKKDVYAPQIVITDSLIEKDLTPTDCYELLNELAEENERLQKENKELKEKNEFAGLLANHRGEMVSFANALIQDLDDETIQDMWENFKDEMYKEWKQKRGIE